MALGWLWSWWRRRSLEHVRVVLFTRQGCHLCEDAEEVLRTEQQRSRFVLSVYDVDSDPSWVAEYGEWVPVVTVNGRVRFRGRVNAVLLGRLLRAEARRQE